MKCLSKARAFTRKRCRFAGTVLRLAGSSDFRAAALSLAELQARWVAMAESSEAHLWVQKDIELIYVNIFQYISICFCIISRMFINFIRFSMYIGVQRESVSMLTFASPYVPSPPTTGQEPVGADSTPHRASMGPLCQLQVLFGILKSHGNQFGNQFGLA